MQRRKFLQGMLASAGAATLPAPAFAKVMTPTATKVIPFHYGWACVYAQMNNGISAADIERVFKIPASDAQGLMDRMLTRGVIHPAGLDGRSHPTKAWEPWDKKTASAQVKSDDAKQSDTSSDDPKTGHRARAKFTKMIDHMKSEPIFTQAA